MKKEYLIKAFKRKFPIFFMGGLISFVIWFRFTYQELTESQMLFQYWWLWLILFIFGFGVYILGEKWSESDTA